MRTVSSPSRFATGADPQLELVAVGELDDLRRRRLGQTRELRRELSRSGLR